jgi:hypothetical protein
MTLNRGLCNLQWGTILGFSCWRQIPLIRPGQTIIQPPDLG